MVKFYVTQIKLGNITIDDVPYKYREQVEKGVQETYGNH